MVVLIKAIQVIAALGLLILLHEGGHFLFAKLFKTRVEKFYLFFDTKFHLFSTYDTWFRRLIHKQPVPRKANGEYEYCGTEYGIGWIPLGGYVKIAGMIDESMDKEQMKQPPKPWEFRTKPAWQRLLIMLGGVLMNFLVAFFIYAMILFTWGQQYIKPSDMTQGMKFNDEAKSDGFRDGDIITGVDNKTFEEWTPANLRDISNGQTVHILRDGHPADVRLSSKKNLLEMLEEPRYATERILLDIDSIAPGTPAAKIGLQAGDQITRINDKPITDFNDVLYALLVLQEQATENMTHADSVRLRTVSITLARTVAGNNLTQTDTVVLTPDFKLGFVNKMPAYTITNRGYGFLESLPAGVKYGWDTLAGYVNDMKYVFTKKGAKSVGGFIAIGNIFPAEWSWYKFWNLTALLSIMLGFMNVLPIPALDGGHAVFAIYEMVTRRKPSDKVLERAQVAGMFILLAILIFANLNDILRLFGIIA